MRITVKELRTLISESIAEVMDEMKVEETKEETTEEAVEEVSMAPEGMEEVIMEAYRAGLLEGRKKAKVAKAKELTPSQKKLDKNKNGKIDAEDFKMLRKSKASKVEDKKSAKK
jgi:hypothetical protein